MADNLSSVQYRKKAEQYLEEAKEYKSSNSTYVELEQHKQTLLLGSIAASLIALSKK